MAKLTKGQLTDMAREKHLSMISDFLAQNGEEILRVGKNAISFPIVLEGGEERFIKLVVSVPRGSRLEGDEYNAFSEAEDYKLHCKENEEKRAAAEKQRKEDAARRAAKQAELRKKKAAEEAAKRASEG